MRSKTQQLDSLFEKWKEHNTLYQNNFKKDGIVNEEKYENAFRKILIITKEPNGAAKPEEGHDFRKWWKETITGGFSSRIAEWSYGILNNFPQYNFLPNTNEKLACEAMHKIAFMNIKKSGGTGSSDNGEILKYLQEDKSLIHEQIDIISPEIVILGFGRAKPLRQELFPNVKWRESGYDILVGKHKKFKVIDFYHPSHKVGSAFYSLLQNVFNSDKFQSF